MEWLGRSVNGFVLHYLIRGSRLRLDILYRMKRCAYLMIIRWKTNREVLFSQLITIFLKLESLIFTSACK